MSGSKLENTKSLHVVTRAAVTCIGEDSTEFKGEKRHLSFADLRAIFTAASDVGSLEFVPGV